METYEFLNSKIESASQQAKKMLKNLAKDEKPEMHQCTFHFDDEPLFPSPQSARKQRKEFDKIIQPILKKVTGVDLPQINGIGPSLTLDIISEIGLNMDKWKTGNRFASWLGFAPNTQISGGKVLSNKTPKVQSHAAKYFRAAAASLAHSDTYLGAFYRNIQKRRGKMKALIATAHKIAIIFYNRKILDIEIIKKKN